jgi:hypothetical protein
VVESGQGPQPLIVGGSTPRQAVPTAVFQSTTTVAMVRNMKREEYTVMRSH